MVVQELFDSVRIQASGAVFAAGQARGIAGFFCSANGTVTIQDASGTDIVSAFPVTAGNFYATPFTCPNGCSVVIAAGAVITVAVAK